MFSKKNPPPFLGFATHETGVTVQPKVRAPKTNVNKTSVCSMHYDLPKPTKEFVKKINALAPDDSEFTVIEG
jgi:hypothetical protein